MKLALFSPYYIIILQLIPVVQLIVYPGVLSPYYIMILQLIPVEQLIVYPGVKLALLSPCSPQGFDLLFHHLNHLQNVIFLRYFR